jgi:hypothetical protein
LDSAATDVAYQSFADDPATLVRAFDADTGRQSHLYIGPGGGVEGVSVSPDGRLVAATKSGMVGADPNLVRAGIIPANQPVPGYLLLWDAQSGALLAARSFQSGHMGDVAFDPSGGRLSFAVDGVIHVLKLNR